MIELNINIKDQPNDETCGPTSLHAIYRYYGYNISLNNVIKGVEKSLSGGTLSPLLGKHALQQGFAATIYVNNMDIFDPVWFKQGGALREALMTKLKGQDRYKQSKGLAQVSKAYQEFLSLGGDVRFQTIDAKMLKDQFQRKWPILTGLSATYLYRTSRECFTSDGQSFVDDVQGTPCGHFVILCGYDDKKRRIVVADPYSQNPFTHTNFYKVSLPRLSNAIMLGVLTYDENLLVIHPNEKGKGSTVS